MKKLFIIITVFLSISHASCAQISKTEKEIDEVLNEFVSAYNEFDGAKINSFMVNDSFFLWLQEGIVVSKDDLDKITPAEIQYNKSTFKSFKYEWIEKEVKTFNSKSAVAICKLLHIWHDNNEKRVGIKWIYTIVLEKKKGDWLIATIQSSALKEVRNF